MRRSININADWSFVEDALDAQQAAAKTGQRVDLPYTWNGKDGQDGGANYKRGARWFVKRLPCPAFAQNERVYLECKAVNASANVFINGAFVTKHDGGYSAFRFDCTKFLHADTQNVLAIQADNSVGDSVYPQTADFTFYGGIYRDVNLVIVNENRISLDELGSCGVRVTPVVEGANGKVTLCAAVTGEGVVRYTVSDADGKEIASGENGETVTVKDAHLWDGIADPYLYTAKAQLFCGKDCVDEVNVRFGFRSFHVDPEKGFFLNGRSYPLRGVCRHQDRPKIGNAISKREHEEDMALIREVGANTVRLAHYQHDDYFYDLCDEAGMIVWAEIPYISKHLKNGDENAVSQMRELIAQQYNHPSIVCWGLSNEITMHRAGKERLALHKRLNDLCHETDKTRLTVVANYVMCGSGNPIAHSADLTSFNLYYGWYVPFCFVTGWVLDHFHRRFPDFPVGLSEYGAESMPNLHAKRPRRGDNTEEYQLVYHEKLIEIINKRDYLWATHVWNMFDFAADARNQGGDPGMNHKGLVTFDRKTKKDSFYLYKAYWSQEPFVHICGRRFVNRTGACTEIKVYSNAEEISLSINGQPLQSKRADRIFTFKAPLNETTVIRAEGGGQSDEITLHRAAKKDKSYKLRNKTKNQSWEK